MGPLVTLFWTFGDVCPRFQNRGEFPCLHASKPSYYGFLRFTSGVTPVRPSAASMADMSFRPLTYSSIGANGFEPVGSLQFDDVYVKGYFRFSVNVLLSVSEPLCEFCT